jgi:hypothetical protein
MSSRIRSVIRDQWVGVLALFLVLTGGTALAANTVDSDDVVDNSLRSVDLMNNQAVRSVDVADDSLTATDLGAGAVGFGELDPAAFAAGDIAPQSGQYGIAADAVQSGEVSSNALTGADISESSLDPSSFTRARSAFDDSCATDDDLFTDCASVGVTLPRAGRVLVMGDGVFKIAAYDNASGFVTFRGTCRLEVDNSTSPIPHSTSTEVGDTGLEFEDASFESFGVGINAVTNALSSGSHTFTLSCRDDSSHADGDLYDATISALMIGSG